MSPYETLITLAPMLKNMKLISLFALLFLCIAASYSQDEILRKDDSLQQLLKQDISDSLKASVFQELIELWKNRNFPKSTEYIKQAIAYYENHNSQITNALGLRAQLGFGYMQVGDAVRSIEVFQQLAKEVEYTYPEYYAASFSFIGMNYENLGDINKALEYELKGSAMYDRLLLHDSVHDRRGVLGDPHKTAVYYLKLNKVDSALVYGQKALSRLNKEPLTDYNRFFSWYIKTLMGDIYSKLNETKKALDFYDQAELEVRQYNSKQDLPLIYLGRSHLYFNQKEFNKAKLFARQAYQIADTLKLFPIVKESATWLKTIYSDQHKMDSALIYYEIAISAKDSIFNTDIARKIDAMEFAEQKRIQELQSLRQEKSFQKKQYYLLTVIFLSILLAVFFYNKNRLKQKANQLLEYENKEMFLQRNQLQQEVAIFEMQALKAQLNPHFIFNCLNSIDAFIYSNDKYKATMYLNKFARLLRNILDSSKNNTVSLGKDIQSLQLYTDLEELRNDNKFETHYQIDESLATHEYVVPPLIIQPLVENAILHGLKNKKKDKGILIVSIKRLGEKLEYQITDNGIGRSASSRIPQHKDHSYGMDLTKSRIKMFNQEERPSIIIEDLYQQDIATGTRISITLNLQTA
jgi:Histidine kinase